MNFDASNIPQMLLQVAILVLLPYVLRLVKAYVDSKVAEFKATADKAQLDFVIGLISELVKAAEQCGLTGALEAIGEEKKRYVMDLAEAELARRGIEIDLDILDSMVEAAVMAEFGKIELP